MSSLKRDAGGSVSGARARRQAYHGQTTGWAIVGHHGIMHTNWLLGGHGSRELWPGMLPAVLFASRAAARQALRSVTKYPPLTRFEKAGMVMNAFGSTFPALRDKQEEAREPRTLRARLAFWPRIVKITISENRDTVRKG